MPDWTERRRIAETEIQRLLEDLPPAIREEAGRIPVVFQEVPAPELVREGLDPDLLGLFVGDDFTHEGLDPIPPEILLFLANLWDEAEGDVGRFRDEIRTTLLHELGHYLGLDEQGLFERGLE